MKPLGLPLLIVQLALLLQWIVLIGLGVSAGVFWLTAVGGVGCAVGTVVAWVIVSRS